MGVEQLRADESEEAQQPQQVAKTSWREGKENSLKENSPNDERKLTE